MTPVRIEVPRDGGVLDGRLFVPEGGPPRGTWPLVVMYMDAYGLRRTLSTMAQRLAARGYAVVQPNLYWRLGPVTPPDPQSVARDPQARERLMQLVHAVHPDGAIADTLGVVEDVAAREPRVRTERFGTVGYCMGGRASFIASEQLADRVIAAACIHPGGLVTDAPESPHRDASEIRGSIYIAAADEDPSFTAEQRETLGRALEAARVDYTMEFFAGARHGFAVPDHTAYDEAAAERQWERVVALFDRML